MTKVLVTGATGFIGSSLVPALIATGHEVRCAVWQKNQYMSVEQVEIDKLEQVTDWSEALDGIDIVIHLAARVHIMKEDTSSSLEEYCKINSVATKNLAEQAAKHKVKRFVFLSTIKVNGEVSSPQSPFSEKNSAQPKDSYAQSKLEAEIYLREISESSGMEVVILRPPLVYGPGVKANFLKLLGMVEKGWPLPFASIKNKRSFIFIDNLVSAILMVMTHPKAANQLYLVADNESWSLADLLSILAQNMRINLRLYHFPTTFLAGLFKITGMGSLNTRLLSSLEIDNSKIISDLGWTPPVDSCEGLKKTADWYQYEYNA
ncbi:NAD-dependent epimerase/dehydratase family protein [Legionella pneumophila]|uniref:NAD-dependent epimerase/dehydratase family protein n=1 Tax=Legionella pneumophila TaxID=446 RepID=UPI00048665D2|nr:NAD-dependent epimerase/dehydratase family protein [Legionella pneumophila]MCK1850735.1 NAD-dependent epimerase/dehydratase family protein [Legionella pneumophila]MCZ4805502.1 NAD-dependent epimerase/dehydratase family protein [Legionella pneumophila]MDI9852999.1 NAD-dependent epimerase/dehydratase family protein [Legionella pneumophila]MDW8866327.1 NAD-dependent epimerase/dehydratase family protein [Legionella pneumophila]MDW9135398.1 NAD-dependent epimerase/dehydratase family protein [Leg